MKYTFLFSLMLLLVHCLESLNGMNKDLSREMSSHNLTEIISVLNTYERENASSLNKKHSNKKNKDSDKLKSEEKKKNKSHKKNKKKSHKISETETEQAANQVSANEKEKDLTETSPKKNDSRNKEESSVQNQITNSSDEVVDEKKESNETLNEKIQNSENEVVAENKKSNETSSSGEITEDQENVRKRAHGIRGFFKKAWKDIKKNLNHAVKKIDKKFDL